MTIILCVTGTEIEDGILMRYQITELYQQHDSLLIC